MSPQISPKDKGEPDTLQRSTFGRSSVESTFREDRDEQNRLGLAVAQRLLVNLDATELGKADRSKLRQIVACFGESDHFWRIPFSRLLECVAPNAPSQQGQQNQVRKFRNLLKQSNLGVTLEVDSQKRSAPEDRRAWFRATTPIEALSLTRRSKKITSPQRKLGAIIGVDTEGRMCDPKTKLQSWVLSAPRNGEFYLLHGDSGIGKTLFLAEQYADLVAPVLYLNSYPMGDKGRGKNVLSGKQYLHELIEDANCEESDDIHQEAVSDWLTGFRGMIVIDDFDQISRLFASQEGLAYFTLGLRTVAEQYGFDVVLVTRSEWEHLRCIQEVLQIKPENSCRLHPTGVSCQRELDDHLFGDCLIPFVAQGVFFNEAPELTVRRMLVADCDWLRYDGECFQRMARMFLETGQISISEDELRTLFLETRPPDDSCEHMKMRFGDFCNTRLLKRTSDGGFAFFHPNVPQVLLSEKMNLFM